MVLIITGIKIGNKRSGFLDKPDLFVYPKVNDRLKTKENSRHHSLLYFQKNARETGTASEIA